MFNDHSRNNLGTTLKIPENVLFKKLLKSIEVGDLTGFKNLLDELPLPSLLAFRTSNGGNTILMKAAKHGTLQMVTYLLEKLQLWDTKKLADFFAVFNHQNLTVFDVVKNKDVRSFLITCHHNLQTIARAAVKEEEIYQKRREEEKERTRIIQEQARIRQNLERRQTQRDERTRREWLEERRQNERPRTQRQEEREESDLRNQLQEIERAQEALERAQAMLDRRQREEEERARRAREERERQNLAQATITRETEEYRRIVEQSGIHHHLQNNIIAAPSVPAKKSYNEQLGDFKGEIPEYAHCIFTEGVMQDPITPACGQTYCRIELLAYFESKGNPEKLPCPLNPSEYIYLNEVKNNKTNVQIKKLIEAFVQSVVNQKKETPVNQEPVLSQSISNQQTQPSQTLFGSKIPTTNPPASRTKDETLEASFRNIRNHSLNNYLKSTR